MRNAGQGRVRDLHGDLHGAAARKATLRPDRMLLLQSLRPAPKTRGKTMARARQTPHGCIRWRPCMNGSSLKFETRLATDAADLRAAQRLRYRVFVDELGGDGPMVDHASAIEADHLDPHYDHLLLLDPSRKGEADPLAPGQRLPPVVGVYRLLPGSRMEAAGGFYSAGEYDLSPLLATGRNLLELGRSCVHPDYRGGTAMFHLWNALAEYVLGNEIEIMFGVASFHGTDIGKIRQPLSYLHANHLAPPELRVRARAESFQKMNLLPPESIERRAALQAIPALIRGYLRLGGFVGDGAYVDHAFNTTDICLVIDTERMSARRRDFYVRKVGS